MDWKNLHGYIEVSPFMLFESTGDSEEDSVLNKSSSDDENIEVSYDEVDDAQSCCSDSSEICDAFDNDEFQECSYSKKTDRKRVLGDDYKCSYRHQSDSEDDGDSAIDQECSSRNVGFLFPGAPKKFKVFVDSKMQPIIKNEENDKLFWDTCLAS
ncbi:hypothetical protein AgCh_006132 [Apium graveolens]